MASSAVLTTRIAALEARIATFAGVSSTAFGDQRTDFDLEGAQKELARLRTELAVTESSSGSRTRYATFSKGV